MKITMKAARVNAGLSQRDAANKLGVSRETIGNWERGKSFPSMKIIPDIEKTYNISYDYIFLAPKDALSVKTTD